MGCQSDGWQVTERKRRPRSTGKACASTLSRCLQQWPARCREISSASVADCPGANEGKYTDSGRILREVVANKKLLKYEKSRKPKTCCKVY